MSPPGILAFSVQAGFMAGKIGLQLVERMLGELAEGGDLAAEDRQHRRLAAAARRCRTRSRGSPRRRWRSRRRRAGARRNRSRPRRPASTCRLKKWFTTSQRYWISSSLIVDLLVRHGLDRDVGGADEGELLLVGDREDDPLVRVLQDEGFLGVEELRHHDVAALHEAHVLLAC